MKSSAVFMTLPLVLAACSSSPPASVGTPGTGNASSALVYPEARRGDHVDVYHGTEVTDPYRWLEDASSAETKAWIEAQNRLTYPYLAKLNSRETIAKRLTRLWNYEKHGIPYQEGGRYFTRMNTGLQNHDVRYWSESLDGTPKVLFDPNSWSKDGTVSLGRVSVSPDGKLAAYGIRSAGSDWREWKVRDVETGKDLSDQLKWIKFSSTAWTSDSKGFYYQRFPEPSESGALTAKNKNHRVYYHKLGDAQDADKLIFEQPDHPTWLLQANVTDDGRFLLLTAYESTSPKNLLWVQDLRKPGSAPVEIVGSFHAEFSVIDNDGPILWVKTDLDAPRSRVIAIDTRKPARDNWTELIAQSPDTLLGVSVVADTFIVDYLRDAHEVILRFSLAGEPRAEMALPGIGSVSGLRGKRRDSETFYRYSSFTTPGAIYRYDVKSNTSTLYRESKTEFHGAAYETSQVFYKSKDGTRIPMFVVHKKGVTLDGTNPTLLRGYGGFSAIESPYYSPIIAAFLEMGGIFANPNLRGGAEFGEEWHRAGTKLEKQNVFDDFIAAAEFLIAKGYTSHTRLAIEGGSNGGLLVGAVMTQRPELFAAAIPHVGVMDMLRFHTFTIGHHWVDDYGSSEDPAQFKALYAYSPYHNLHKGTCYPATMVLTADHDDRVVPAHSYKFAAELQRAQGCNKPAVIRIQSKAGHGAGTPTEVRIKTTTDIFGFIFEAFGFQP